MKDSIRLVILNKDNQINEIFERKFTPKGNIPKALIDIMTEYKKYEGYTIVIEYVDFTRLPIRK